MFGMHRFVVNIDIRYIPVFCALFPLTVHFGVVFILNEIFSLYKNLINIVDYILSTRNRKLAVIILQINSF